ncbi:hypothetical protein R3P38DRAFT_3246341 [Favolaschia claudopus]|uniref:Uncharacterized protein n=1 Tax=Favolaschia claudopus TaxID=2862362 RepID=A0AAV9YZG6_9AGAR
MVIVLAYPNNVYDTKYCDEYDEQHEALEPSDFPVQYQSLSRAFHDAHSSVFNHCGPEAVPFPYTRIGNEAHVTAAGSSFSTDVLTPTSEDWLPILCPPSSPVSTPSTPSLDDSYALEQLGFRAPGILLLRSYSTSVFRQLLFATPADAVEYINSARILYHYYLHWIADAIRLSIQFGYQTAWHWGLPLSVSHTEFLHCVTRNVYKTLEKYMSHHIRRNEMDFCMHPFASSFTILIICAVCSSLFTTEEEAEALLFINHADRSNVTMFPMEFEHDPAEQLLRVHLAELNCTTATLSLMVAQNRP